LDFESAGPLVVKSIRQRELLNGWLTLYAREQSLPQLGRVPFSRGNAVTDVIASLKTICEDGGFELKNLMRGNDARPRPRLRVVIDRELFHRPPGRIPAGDLIEFG